MGPVVFLGTVAATYLAARVVISQDQPEWVANSCGNSDYNCFAAHAANVIVNTGKVAVVGMITLFMGALAMAEF
jgi:hypothetical protein